MEITGKIIAVLEPRGGVSKTGNPWKVQEYVLETNEQYPRKMCFDVFGEDKIQQFNIQAWQGRWFNSIRAWKVERPSQNAGMQPQPADYSFPPVSSAPVPPADFSATDEKDDLPF